MLGWQFVLDFAERNPAFFTAVAFATFWFLRFALGHKCRYLTCWRWTAQGGPSDSWRGWFDLHDWEKGAGTEHEFFGCSRCFRRGRKI